MNTQSTSPIHIDVSEIMEENPISGLTKEQEELINTMLQYAWNRGYKKGYAQGDEDCYEQFFDVHV